MVTLKSVFTAISKFLFQQKCDGCGHYFNELTKFYRYGYPAGEPFVMGEVWWCSDCSPETLNRS